MTQGTTVETRINIGSRKILKTTSVFDTYWRFAAKRQELFMRRVRGEPAPWTDDHVLASHRFTNAYRASDRVSQYLIRQVLYEGSQTGEEIFFRAPPFKLFNRIDTWEKITSKSAHLPGKHLISTGTPEFLTGCLIGVKGFILPLISCRHRVLETRASIETTATPST